MPIPYRQRKEYFRQYYQQSKGVKNGVKINTSKQPQDLTPKTCQKCHELETLKKEHENLRQQLESEKEQKREYWRQQKKQQRAKVSKK